MMLNEHRTPKRFWGEAMSTACYVANRIFLRAFLKRTSYELRFGRQPKVSHLRVFGCKCFVLKEGNLDKFESRSSDGIFLGYSLHSRAYRVLIIETNRIVETCEVTFDETAPCTNTVFECAGDDELGMDLFKEEEVEDEPGAPAPTAAAPGPLAESSDDDDGPMPTASTTVEFPAPAHGGPAEDTREVTSEAHPSQQVQRDHPSTQIIGDLHTRVSTRSRFNSLAVIAHSLFVSSFEPKDIRHALSDPN